MTTITMTEFLWEVNKYTQLVSSGEELVLRLQNGEVIKMSKVSQTTYPKDDLFYELSKDDIEDFDKSFQQIDNKTELLTEEEAQSSIQEVLNKYAI